MIERVPREYLRKHRVGMDFLEAFYRGEKPTRTRSGGRPRPRMVICELIPHRSCIKFALAEARERARVVAHARLE